METIDKAASLTIYKANKMTKEQKKEVASWLRQEANDLVKFGNQYAKRMTARYFFNEPKA
jgi:hypothetical protein